MPPTNSEIREFVCNAQFKELFIQLGWDNVPASQQFRVSLKNGTFDFQPIAHKRGFVVLMHESPSADSIPDRATGLKIENKLTPLAAEHLLIFTDRDRTRQIWQWSRRAAGSPTRISRETYFAGTTGERLAQRLSGLFISLGEEDDLTIADVSRRAEAQFRERITKRFYDRFKAEHEKFSKHIEGIVSDFDRDQFASLTLNRLMFVYFVQSKGFLNDDKHYLKTKLAETRRKVGGDMFYAFYETFLARFFHEGLGESDHSPELVALIGKVPYLNGGLFERHSIEVANTVAIKDEAFEKIFDFFDDYDWHLDDRPLRDDRHINPEVLGYIFEKFINQKQMGAYYTKEDITEYISKNTVIPFLFDRAKEKVNIAFHKRDGIWKLLREDPDRYIYDAVRKGVIDEDGNLIEVPTDIAAGIDDVKQRTGWNRTTDSEFGLPTETWREYIARRQRFLEVRDKLTKGEVHDINDLITYNLDIRRFAEDVIFTTESSDLVKAFYHAIAGRIPEKSNERFEHGISVLDPTCGSGAFLFSALKILEPLLSACLDRIEDFVEDEDRLRPDSKKFASFRRVLDEAAKHPNEKYFILKSIIVNNLFGVDIMPDAVEICKLRLFLTLVAEVEPDLNHKNYGLEPLPDIDFNIRSGNTLVGFATEKQVYEAFGGAEQGQGRFEFDTRADDFKWRAEQTATAYEQFRLQQIKEGGEISHEDKAELIRRLRELSDELDIYTAHEYGIEEADDTRFAQFLVSHQPFHWYSEFYSIIANGGFDVIVGNPPWKEYSSVKKTYTVRNYLTEACGNLHGMCTERALAIRKDRGSLSMIVQLPLASSSRMASVRSVLRNRNATIFSIPFDDRPGKLFDGLQHCRSIIFLARGHDSVQLAEVLTSRYQRWATVSRESLFATFEFAKLGDWVLYPDQFPKHANERQNTAFRKIKQLAGHPVAAFSTRNATQSFIFYQEATQYWVKATLGLPYYSKNGDVGPPAHGRYVYFDSPQKAKAVCAVLNSSLFYLGFIAYSDCFHLSGSLVSSFPVTSSIVDDPKLADLCDELMTDLRDKSELKTISTSGGDSISYAEFNASSSKTIIDQIDQILAKHYGFTDEELDFIINYDIKYRMGAEED